MLKTRLFAVLDERGISHRWLARQIGLHESTLSLINKGKRSIPPRIIPDVVRVLQLPESVLFYEEEKAG